MYDLQRIGKIIADIEKYKKELDSYNIKYIEDLDNSKNYNASSMVIFAILNRTIDLCTEIISAEHLGAPNSYQDIMPLLAKANVLNKDKANKINSLLKQRNVFAHFYEDIKEKDLLSTIKQIPEIIDLISIIKKRVDMQT